MMTMPELIAATAIAEEMTRSQKVRWWSNKKPPPDMNRLNVRETGFDASTLRNDLVTVCFSNSKTVLTAYSHIHGLGRTQKFYLLSVMNATPLLDQNGKTSV